MFIKPEGPALTAEQARVLDDDFFTSRPLEYFASRIASLIESSTSTAEGADIGLGSDFAAIFGRTHASQILGVDPRDRQLQTVVDCLAVRHHVAEALARFYHALTVGAHDTRGAPDVACTWAAICHGPRQTAQLVTQARDHLLSDTGRATFWTLVICADEPGSSRPAANTSIRIQLMADWLIHALQLLARDDIDVNAAHNKLKHGLAVRSRDDLRVAFIQHAPEAGTVPLSALTSPDAIDLIDTVSLDYLSRPPATNGRKQGMEVTTLRLAPATLLAETWMMALAYGAMFHVAATRHFDTRQGVQFAAYPDVPTGPAPDQLLRDSLIGIRRPLTTPPDGGTADRGAGFAFHQGFIPVNIGYDQQESAVIVDG